MRIVIKIGTSTLTHSNGNMNIRHVERLCCVISDLKNAGHDVIMVSSGAIGMGVGRLSLREKPKDMPTKQAAAAVGQCEPSGWFPDSGTSGIRSHRRADTADRKRP